MHLHKDVFFHFGACACGLTVGRERVDGDDNDGVDSDRESVRLEGSKCDGRSLGRCFAWRI